MQHGRWEAEGGGGSTHPVGALLASFRWTTYREYVTHLNQKVLNSIRPTSKDLPVPINLGAVLFKEKSEGA